MAKPTSDPTWATDAAYASDGDAWSGDANKVDPGATRQAEGVEPDVFPAEWFNFHLNALGAHVEYVHSILEADGSESIPAVTRTLILHGSAFRGAVRGVVDAPPPGLVVSGDGLNLVVFDTDTLLACPLNRLLPFGAAVTRIDLLITPGTHTTGGVFSLRAVNPDFTTPGAGTAVIVDSETSSGTSIQVLSLTVAFAIGATYLHYLIWDPTDLLSSADTIHAIRIQYTDPGPRNF